MSAETTYLVADIGGTNARFAIARGNSREGFVLEQIQRLKNQDFEHLHDAAKTYLEGCSGAHPERGCFAVAGPVNPGLIQLTNSSWSFEPRELGRHLGLKHLLPVNDFAAQARGAPLASPQETSLIREGEAAPNAPCAVLGPGTGLGLGLLVPHANDLNVLPTEGGHAGFSPRTEEESAVATFLRAEYGFASWERVLSGQGLLNIYRALCLADGTPWPEYSPEKITEEALTHPGSRSARTVQLFCSALGAFAGDVAVMSGARGGIYLGGGILPKIQALLRESDFEARFIHHDPMTDYVASIPVWLILSDTAPLLGAAALAEKGDL